MRRRGAHVAGTAASLVAVAAVAACGTTHTVTKTVTTTTTTTTARILGLKAAKRQTEEQGDQEPVLSVPGLGIRCGRELWPIKTLTDADASQVQLDPVLPTTIAAINALPVPADPETRDGDNFELHAYQVTAFVVGYKLEADNDWHVVLSDDGSEVKGHTLIVELPNPACAQPPLEATASRVLAQITQARAAFETAFPPLAACFECGLKTLVTMVGVGFFDKIHGQHGVALNGAELHPVIGFNVGGPPPQPKPVKQRVPTPAPKHRAASGCTRYPGRHWFKGKRYRYCRAKFSFTKHASQR